ncbi:hypothetical protein BNJ_00183 [Kaumoebavirus]|uniref:hypothetical protein n=1 Tax=Kaumoebavirus TaxID=1859492 RepID=UPI0009C2DF6C|nr:hypothetical protein BNJ_00183 [Kaumoebavirus]ARA72014.1 hypothetical protein BNJ_00183 [Kaumoebavirus]
MASFEVDGRYYELRPSTIKGAGLGLFSLQDICRGTIIGKYEGRLFSKNKVISSLREDYLYTNRFDEQIIPDFEKNPFAYANDIVDVPMSLMFGEVRVGKKECNLEWKEGMNEHIPDILVVADVMKGDELFISYGDGYWNWRIRNPKFRSKIVVGGDVLQQYFIQKMRYDGERECD